VALVARRSSGLGYQCDNEVGAEGGGEAFKDADGGHGSTGFERPRCSTGAPGRNRLRKNACARGLGSATHSATDFLVVDQSAA
jgi:hypothetical protein